MCKGIIISAALVLIMPFNAECQNGFSLIDEGGIQENRVLFGFVRGGFYSAKDKNNKFHIPSAYSDLALKLDINKDPRFRGYADFRYRYGTEFGKEVNKPVLREGYVTVMGKKWDISAGQKIVKWGRADFTNPTQKLSPTDHLTRSSDREDMDMGNIMLAGRWFPSPSFTLEAAAIPFYRSSVLIIEPVELPSFVKLDQIGSLITDREMFSYAVKADFHIRGSAFSLSYFDGYDPMPGMDLKSISVDTILSIPFPSVELGMKPYRIRNIGFDFETAAGDLGIRGEAAVTLPELSYKYYMYVPCSEAEWAGGIDWMKGKFRITGEYSGKYIINFEEAAPPSLIGAELDPDQFAGLLMNPDFDLEEYITEQISSFNRLYNYQLEKTYHSAALRVEADFFYEKLTPSLTSLYNFTSRDFLLIPEILWKPADGITICVGGEFFSGRKGSIYDIIDEFMNCIRASLKISF